MARGLQLKFQVNILDKIIASIDIVRGNKRDRLTGWEWRVKTNEKRVKDSKEKNDEPMKPTSKEWELHNNWNNP